MDGSGPDRGRHHGAVQERQPTWTSSDADPFSGDLAGQAGHDRADRLRRGRQKAKMRPGFGWDYAASTYFFSYIIAYDAAKVRRQSADRHGRLLRREESSPASARSNKWGAAMWEAALLADGVAPEKLYPLDLKRAPRQDRRLQGQCRVLLGRWGGEPVGPAQRRGLVALIWSTRASLLEQDSGGRSSSSGTRA